MIVFRKSWTTNQISNWLGTSDEKGVPRKVRIVRERSSRSVRRMSWSRSCDFAITRAIVEAGSGDREVGHG